MYLKSLEAIGFKSFADRTAVDFHPGITAIVGPNGCGKSNILDAVRWVLGEQSAKALRGGSMQDVIFSGTDTRKGHGMAEISLTFADCESVLGTDFHELTVTRRVFRDGQGEYEINRTACRLRDVQQLFMDTGIGRTAYSMLEQGKIDQVLSSRPEDRRAIFEEAAGITRYKTQKKEALRKLENTDANLLRLDDILQEVRRQIGSLQRQAGKARRYQEIAGKLKTLECQLARHKADALAEELRELEGSAAQARARQQQLHLDLESCDEQLQQARTQLAAFESELSRAREEAAQARHQADRAQLEQQQTRDRVADWKQQLEQTARDAAATQEKQRTCTQEEERISQTLASAESARSTTAALRTEKETALRAATTRVEEQERQIAAHQAQVRSAEQAHAALQQQIAGLGLQAENLTARAEHWRQEMDALGSRLNATQEKQTADANRRTELTLLKEEVAATNSQTQSALAEQRAQLESRQQAQQEAQGALQAVRTKHEMLLELQSPTTDPGSALASLLQAVGDGALPVTLEGPLEKAVEVDAGYERAVAALLADALSTVAVPNAAAAVTVHAHLTSSGKPAGRITLAPKNVHGSLPSMSQTDPQLTPAATRVRGKEAWASDLLQALLNESFIADTLEAALGLKAQNPSARIASLDGALVTREGLVHLGHASVEHGAALERPRQIRLLEEQLQPLTQKAQEATQSAEQARTALRTLEQQAAESRERVHQAELAAAHLEQEAVLLTQAAEDLRRQREVASQSLQAAENQLVGIAQERAALTQKLEAGAGNHGQEAAQAQTLAQALEALKAEELAASQSVTQETIALATHEQQIVHARAQADAARSRAQELTERMQAIENQRVELESKMTSAAEAITQADAAITQYHAQAQELQMRAESSQGRQQELQRAVQDRETTLRGRRKELDAAQAARSDHDVRVAQKRMALEHLAEQISRAYQLTLDALPALEVQTDPDGAPLPVDWTALEAETAALRQKLDGMGPVNLEAITEYEALEERHQFLTRQQADLVQAKEQLLQAITQMNVTSRKLFTEMFERVQVHFQEMFRELFGGGKSGLVLQDESDPLECGIEIIAKPPGKQLQSITLLSGGERTMTAVALLFALYQVKPSPFCILDELDAPLDESNIQRFVQIVKRFVQQSQFIVITHNKRTIAAADVLYGVTMQESGVSKIISVALSGAKADDSAASTSPPNRAGRRPASAPAAEDEMALDSADGQNLSA